MNHNQLDSYIATLGLGDVKRSITSQGKFYCLSMHGSQVENVWRILRERVDETLRWPVVIGETNDALELIDYASKTSEEETAWTIEQGLKLDVSKWLEEAKAQQALYTAPSAASAEASRVANEASPFSDFFNSVTRVFGKPSSGHPKPVQPPRTTFQKYSFATPTDMLSKAFLPEVNIALPPTALPWEIPAYLKYGDWNGCPAQEIHVALFKRWHELHGAEVFAMVRDVVELHVRRPPTTPAEAVAVAQEQYLYCPDIVLQGTDTIEGLSNEIINTDGWFFWWD